MENQTLSVLQNDGKSLAKFVYGYFNIFFGLHHTCINLTTISFSTVPGLILKFSLPPTFNRYTLQARLLNAENTNVHDYELG